MFTSVPYRVYLPVWVFKNVLDKQEIIENAKRYIQNTYPEKEFVRVEGQFAICKSKF